MEILSIELDGLRARKWNSERVIFFNTLSSNAHKALTILRRFESAFFFDSTCGIVECLASSWKTRTTPLWVASERLWELNYGGASSNIFEPYPERENCAKPYNLSGIEKREGGETIWIGCGLYRHDQRDRLIGFGGETSEQNIPSCATLETYEKTPILIPVDITEEAV